MSALETTNTSTTSLQNTMPLSRRKPKTKLKRCKICNNLDPREHKHTHIDTESSRATLCCSIDLLHLASVPKNGCRFCQVLIRALDKLIKDWRHMRTAIIVDLAEGKTIKVTFTQGKEKKWLEIYSPKGQSVVCHQSRTKYVNSRM